MLQDKLNPLSPGWPMAEESNKYYTPSVIMRTSTKHKFPYNFSVLFNSSYNVTMQQTILSYSSTTQYNQSWNYQPKWFLFIACSPSASSSFRVLYYFFFASTFNITEHLHEAHKTSRSSDRQARLTILCGIQRSACEGVQVDRIISVTKERVCKNQIQTLKTKKFSLLNESNRLTLNLSPLLI